MRKPNTVKVIEFLKKYIARHGIPQKIRTDPARIFRSKRFKEFCSRRCIQHIECPIKDHKGNGKIERLIRTINEQLRTNEEIVVKRDKSGLSEILFALRKNPSATKRSPYERYTGREPNTIKRIFTNPDRTISDNPAFPLHEGDFESGQDSTILVRERSRGTKMEGAYQKRKGVLMEQSNHTITFLPAGRSQSTIISKRDIGNMDQQPYCSKWVVNTATKDRPKIKEQNPKGTHKKDEKKEKQNQLTKNWHKRQKNPIQRMKHKSTSNRQRGRKQERRNATTQMSKMNRKSNRRRTIKQKQKDGDIEAVQNRTSTATM